jgi:hypothetical protein
VWQSHADPNSDSHGDAHSDSNTNCYSNGDAYTDSNTNGDCDGNYHRIANGDAITGNSSYADTASSPDASASSIVPVAASLPATPNLREGGCEAQSTIASGVEARLTETRLQRQSI